MRFQLIMLLIIMVMGIVMVVIGISTLDKEKVDDDSVFHVTLADPALYVEGVFSEEFWLESGDYRLGFVPNGDSPEVLSIMISGESMSFSENFVLDGTLHTTGISEYYTWEYAGESILYNEDAQTVRITINPNWDLQGPVSVSLIKE